MSPGVLAVLGLLAGHVHLQQQARGSLAVTLDLGEGRLALNRVDHPDERQHLLDLAALEMPDEVEGERLAPLAVLDGQRLGRVLAHQLDTGGRQCAHQLGRDVLGRGQQLDVARVSSGSLARPLDAIAHRCEVRAHAAWFEVL